MFFNAIKNRAYNTLNQLINLVDINITDEFNNTALHIAAQIDDYNIVKLLVDHGADVNAENIYGETPYFLAGTNEIIREYLREHGAHPYTSYNTQNTISISTINTTMTNPKNYNMNINNNIIVNNPRKLNGGRRKQTRKRRNHTRRRRRGGGFSISYSGIPVRGQEFTKEQTASPPQVQIPKGYYVVMADSDAVNPDWIHWIATSERDILRYQGPSPPPGTGIHKYRLYLVSGNPPPPPKTRGGQSATALAPNPVAVVEFTVASEKN